MTNIRIYDDDAERIERIAESEDVYIADIIAELLDEYEGGNK